jgi:hypothetical protein
LELFYVGTFVQLMMDLSERSESTSRAAFLQVEDWKMFVIGHAPPKCRSCSIRIGAIMAAHLVGGVTNNCSV